MAFFSARPARSTPGPHAVAPLDSPPAQGQGEAPPPMDPARGYVEDFLHDRPIGRLLSERLGLDAAVVERVLAFQRERGLRFGEAVVAMGIASADDVLQALSQQFHYPVASAARRADSPELVTLNEPFSDRAEAFRALRSQLGLRPFGVTPSPRERAWAVISPEPGDGRSYCAANLAVALAQRGEKTLLVDADLRHPRQHLIFRVDPAAGLSSVLIGRGSARAIRPVPPLPGLSLVPAGAVPPNPLELVERPLFGLLLQEWAASFDHVVVDTPAAAHGADATAIAAQSGAALLVVRRDRARVQALRALLSALPGASLRWNTLGEAVPSFAPANPGSAALALGVVYNEL